MGVSKMTDTSASTVSQLFSTISDSSWPSPQAEYPSDTSTLRGPAPVEIASSTSLEVVISSPAGDSHGGGVHRLARCGVGILEHRFVQDETALDLHRPAMELGRGSNIVGFQGKVR